LSRYLRRKARKTRTRFDDYVDDFPSPVRDVHDATVGLLSFFSTKHLRENTNARVKSFFSDFNVLLKRVVCATKARACRVTNAWQSSARKISGIV